MSKLIIDNITKSYNEGSNKLEVLKGINLELVKGEIVALKGPSGSGKTTLLNIISLLDEPTSGKIIINNINCTNINEKEKTLIRRNNIGFVFQFHHLLFDFTILENVMMPQLLIGKSKNEAKLNSEKLLSEVGLNNKLNSFPSEISGGERQRVAIARAIVNNPSLIIADEPTGNLDPKLSNEICDLLIEQVKTKNSIAIIATHNYEIAKKIGKEINLNNGVIS